ncbi:MAG: alanine--tRNA ligase [Desulfobacterium sp.]|nr:alanine--tRNA ligase [Desulfobacterium sp.]
MTGNQARRLFIEYFKKHHHHHVRSSSLVPSDDPTLLFTNAGMVQFKRVFTGDEKRDYNLAVTAQKCVRAGGKHNDLENVGYTARHHTFFEMLGNFSFGQYFKDKAIEYAWDLLTNGYGFDREKLWVSVYLDDDEAYNIWRDKIGVSEDRIVRLGEEDNFWSMGDTGPCGPCSEIHIDRGEKYGCDSPDCAVGCECDRYLELWNLVFMQFYRDETGTMTPLPKPSIDTGLGLERVISVLQDVPTNYETDLFLPIIERVEVLSGRRKDASDENNVAMKVIADHSRAAAFLICDGILPSNEGKGYVLRRIMRRAIRYGRNLGLVRPFLHETVQQVFEIMDQAYPELKESSAFILNVVKNEEEKFSETLDVGLRLLNETIDGIEQSGSKQITGDVIFKLYDTFGFPVDIINDVVVDRDITLDMDGYNRAMDDQRARSKSSKHFTGVGEAYKGLTSQGVKTLFTGYEDLETTSEVLLIVKADVAVTSAVAGDQVEIVTQATPFYGESGGQAGDSGTIKNKDCTVAVENTLVDPSGLRIHHGRVVSGTLLSKASVLLSVDQEQRVATALNHTATHLLHAALRKVLGDHVKQSGSLVTKDRLRFDFTHFAAITRQEIEALEGEVNLRIRENVPVATREMDMDEAVKSGATALFEEKYGDRVRVVSMAGFSSELCGGTHTDRSGSIGLFQIVSEGGIASGIRRMEALTGARALDHVQAITSELMEASQILKSARGEVVEKVKMLVADRRSADREIASLKAKIASKSVENIDDDIRDVDGVRIVSKLVQIDNPSQLRDLADKFKAKIGSGVVLLGAESNGKALLISVVTDDLTSKFKAGSIVKKAAAIVGGGGGGRPDMAQAGGSKPEFLDKALASVFAP